MLEENKLNELKEKDLEKVSGGTGLEDSLYHAGQYVCVLDSLIVEITKVNEKGRLETDYKYDSTILGYSKNCSDSMKSTFLIGDYFSFFENAVSYIVE